jgi:MYXO-CTERM domain-containing protein
MPAASTAANSLGTQVIGNAGSKRGVSRVELYLNGFKWATVPGAAFTKKGQPDPSPYQFLLPTNVPDSIIDIQLKAYDDLELVGESPVVTAVKGKAGGCTAAEECAEGQKCEAGKCFWDQPTGNVGDPCTFPQACLSGRCSDDVVQGDGICTQSCVAGLADACPAGLECVKVGNDSICYTGLDDGGCCSTGGGSPLGAFVLGGFVLGFIVIRRKR